MEFKAKRVVAMSAAMPDQVGLFAQLARVMKEDGVDMFAAAAWAADGTAHLMVVPKDADAARKCAAKQGLEVKEAPAIRIKGDDEVGALLPAAKALAEAGIGLTVAQAVAAGGKFSAILMVANEDYEKACRALGI